MSIARVNGVELYYEDCGSGECIVLTHGSWTDADGWRPAATLLAEHYRVVSWDRRGHSRSGEGNHPGSRAEDAADLAGIIEHVSGVPVHVVGNSYGASVTLTLAATRPELVTSVSVHEPPLFGLLYGSHDPTVLEELVTVERHLRVVGDLIAAQQHRDAAGYFIDNIALGPGAWDQLSEEFRATLERNAPTYLDEMADETALTLDTTELAAGHVPILLTYSTDSPPLFAVVIATLRRSVELAVEIFTDAGHIPHFTNTEQWVSALNAFHQRSNSTRASRTRSASSLT